MIAGAGVVVLGCNGLPRDVVVQLLDSQGHRTVAGDAVAEGGATPVVVLVEPDETHWREAKRTGRRIVLIARRPPTEGELVDHFERGADAVLDTDTSFDEVLRAIDVVARGDALLMPGHARALLDRLRDRAQEPDVVPGLTRREADILHSIDRGESVKQTARALGISEKTIQNLQGRLYRKIGARNRAHAIARAHELGLVADAPARGLQDRDRR